MSDMPEPQQRSWFGRNWKWLVPVGCLLPIVVCGGGIVALVFFGLSVLKNTAPYKDGVAKAKANPAVVAALGEPIEGGSMVGGTFNVRNVNGQESGDVDLTIPLTGPKGTGTLRVVGKADAGKWTYSTMEVTIAGQAQPINLLGAEKEKPAEK